MPRNPRSALLLRRDRLVWSREPDAGYTFSDCSPERDSFVFELPILTVCVDSLASRLAIYRGREQSPDVERLSITW